MTTYVQARDTLAAFISAAIATDKPAWKVFYENADKPDVNTVGDQYIVVAIDFLSAKQATIEYAPKRRSLGDIVFRVVTKEGLGTRSTLEVFDYVEGLLANKIVGGITLRTAVPGKKRTSAGWTLADIAIPFVFDSTP